ncbi:MAG: hypothetical protein IJU23_06900, partial [Proteobacteria bacterium]|nr:hypothetical protein [Pseudomonadota bacterium]
MPKLTLTHTVQLPSGKALAVAISPDGKLCAAGDRDGYIHIIDVKSGEIVRKLGRHVEFVYTLAFNPDNGHLFSAGKDKSIREWDIETGTFIKDHAGIFVNAGARSMNSQALKAGTRSHSMTILDIALEKGGIMATASQDKHLKYWKDFEPFRTYDWHSAAVTCVRFQPETGILYSASRDKTIRSWNEINGAVINKYNGHYGEIIGLEFLDETTLVSSDNKGQVIVWNSHSESPALFVHESASPIFCSAILRKNKLLFLCLEHGSIELVII